MPAAEPARLSVIARRNKAARARYNRAFECFSASPFVFNRDAMTYWKPRHGPYHR